MSVLDPVLVALFVLSAFAGYRRGAILQVFGLIGVALGVLAGVLVAPGLADLSAARLTRGAIVVGTVLIAAAIGNSLGWLVGTRVKRRADRDAAARVDAAVGAGVSVVALLLATWFLALNLANGPFPMLARGIRDSRIVRVMAAALPPPPQLIPQLERVADALGFPDVFIGLPPVPAEPVPPPDPDDVAAAVRAADASTVLVLGRGCLDGYLNEGSGFVAAAGYVVTNAHVVAGITDIWVQRGPDGGHEPAEPIVFDPDLDVAILHVPTLSAPPLALELRDVARGTGGAVLGFPAGRPAHVAAAVRSLIEPVGRDIYAQGEVKRRVYELQAEVRRGNSGGPFVLPDGRVAGVVFANSVLDEEVGYAIAADQVAPLLERAVGLTAPVGVGPCTAD
jgi:S1-C subfamily serine protease